MNAKQRRKRLRLLTRAVNECFRLTQETYLGEQYRQPVRLSGIYVDSQPTLNLEDAIRFALKRIRENAGQA